jgi:hypothetical protein
VIEPLIAAAANNAEWCAAVSRTHGVRSSFGERAWRASDRTPPFYPEAVTLRPAAVPGDVLPGGELSGYSVKDSFADLDLAPHGFTKLFDAQWIHRPPDVPAPPMPDLRIERVTAGGFREWQVAWHGGDDVPDIFRPALLDDPAVSVLAFRRGDELRGGELVGGAALNRSGDVVGVSNLFGGADAWAAAINAVPGVALVGYEQGDDLGPALHAGFDEVGPLRVWLHE